MRHSDITRYDIVIDTDKPVIDTDIPIDLRPSWNEYKNNHFALRKRCLNIFLKFVNKLIIRQRAGKRLARIKERFISEGVKNRDDAKRMVVEDWKTAQGVFIDDTDHVDFKFVLLEDKI
jgi:hypothetical protein